MKEILNDPFYVTCSAIVLVICASIFAWCITLLREDKKTLGNFK